MNSIDQKWLDSQLYKVAHATYLKRVGLERYSEAFDQSQEFRDARNAFRKTVNGSWGMEAC